MNDLENKIETKFRRKRTGNNVLGGILILAIGGVFLLREMGFRFPGWLFTWPMILIVVGAFIGFATRFRDFSWLIVTSVGLFFLVDDIWTDVSFRRYIWPMAIIVIGLVVIFRPRSRSTRFKNPDGTVNDPGYTEAIIGITGSAEDVLDVTAIFGGVKKNIYSKTFKGGEIVCIFGGTEINLTHADFPGNQVTIEAVQLFGGTKLIVPANWDVRSEAVAIFGGLEDKRPQPTVSQPEKILILSGFAMFGGIEIKSF